MSIEACSSDTFDWEGGKTETIRCRLLPSFGTATCEFISSMRGQIASAADFAVAVQEERQTILSQKEYWQARGVLHLQTERLEQIQEASSGVYLLLGDDNAPLKVVKPADEGISCLNNPFFHSFPGRPPLKDADFPFYGQPEREAACYEIDQLLGFNLAPKTELAIIASTQFSDIADEFETLQQGDTEKLCSLRDYVGHAMMLFDLYFHSPDFDDVVFDPQEVENLALLCWITGNWDCHGGNLLAYPKAVLDDGKILYGLKIIDQGLSFPRDNNASFSLDRFFFDLDRKLSDAAKNLIAHLPVAAIARIVRDYGLEKGMNGCLERIKALQKLAASDGTLDDLRPETPSSSWIRV